MANNDMKTDNSSSQTHMAQSTLLNANKLSEGIEAIRGQFVQKSIRQYFESLLEKKGMRTGEAVRFSGLDKDYGRQLIYGERTGRRDYYIQLAFGINLNLSETQSMLTYIGVGILYALRERDAAIMYALQNNYSLMDVQLLLEKYGLTPLGDTDENIYSYCPPPALHDVKTIDMEKKLLETKSFEVFSGEMNDDFTRLSINAYFDALLLSCKISRRQLIDLAGLADKSNLVFQLLNGTRISRNRDIYIRLAIAMELDLQKTQSLLKFLKKGILYPLKERDAALIYCIDRTYSLSQTQQLLKEHGLEEI